MKLSILKKIREKYNKKEKLEEKIELDLSTIVITEEEIKKLKKATKEFFPNHGGWSSVAYRKEEDSFFCHLRDDYWLSKKLCSKIPDIELAKVLKFVKQYEFFKQERHAYEQRIVKWQINFMMVRKEGWIADDFIEWKPNCDINFRQAIIDTLVAIGLDQEAIEEGIEKNASIWRGHYINQAFENEYNNFLWNANLLGSNYGIEIPNALAIHKEKWIKLRKYEYFIRHMKSVTDYGKVEELVDMLMTAKDVLELREELKSLNNERMEEIESFKQQREKAKTKNKQNN